MATNKHAMIRYQALDACFANRYKRFFIEDLIEACNKALQEFYLSKEDTVNDVEYYVKRRTIFNDIAFMQSEEGWSAPIKRFYESHRCYYRYEDENFSINKRDFSQAELDTLDEALIMLNRLNGTAGFDWVSEFIANFEDKLGRKKNTTPVIGYEKNPFLTGIENLSVLYNYIVNKRVLKISYQHFTQGEMVHIMHPYYLKQYNNRWFLFGITEQNREVLTNLALDRIANIELADTPYIPNTSFDFEEYFDDVVGVSVPRSGEPEKVVLKISEKQYPYIKTKPLHPSQVELDKDNRIIQLDVFLNWELESLILSYGDDIEVIEPISLRERIQKRINNLLEIYNCAE
ncbi:MAG: helix-turn-helix transcriptional regulator [Candidatus Cryptobacteroides sp.]